MARDIKLEPFLQTQFVIHLALVIGQCVFAFIAYYLVSSGEVKADEKDLEMAFMMIVPAAIIGGFVVGKFLFINIMQKVHIQKSIEEKLALYRTASILQYALLEGPSLLAIVAYLLTGSLLFLGIAGLVVAYFFMIRPTMDKIESDLELKEKGR